MDWRLKCTAFYALRYLPRTVYTFLQRHVTRRHFIQLSDAEYLAYDYHVTNLKRLASTRRALEFGAGSNLLTALMLSAAGAEEIRACDIQRLATVEQVNHVIALLRLRMPGKWPDIHDLDEDLWRKYRVRYCAPMDARHTGLAAQSVDLFYSTSTLEHIPPRTIVEILAECRRIAAPQALFSFIIDYHDHYASADPHISRFNFYRYSSRAWRWFNPANHYQNRLRHVDYERIFSRQGLRTIDARRVTVPEAELEGVQICGEFSHYTRLDLSSLNGYFLLTV